ncbi:MAG: NADH-quinone oxidoreductase subunit NuoE [Candidatus Tectomicrobia bacterium]|uniref:NADH-quinone oxidoreductase subunit NuoE n=1 Tax=Tectimicrobiota bacterium TaxID=2528274 RepID=A0A933GL26_UNCTE|nr:NADH-quinone oxidoreductase subunit NuoE [Candidatus Tectomicrobia bacterium]
MEFSQETKEKFTKILEKYPVTEAALLPTLHLAQKEFGYLSTESMDYVAQLLGLPPVRVYGVASFYTMFNRKPVGKYHIQVCTNLSCSLMGAEEMVKHLENRLHIKMGQTSADGKFTLSSVECLGSCGTAPMMQINDLYYENLTSERIDQIVAQLEAN